MAYLMFTKDVFRTQSNIFDRGFFPEIVKMFDWVLNTHKSTY